MEKKQDFLRKIVQEDLKSGKYKEVVTRFPPEPNGYLHIGHAKSIAINFGIAKEFGGKCNLRMDDTNPTTEDMEYVKAIEEAVHWLGFDWDGDIKYASNYFDKLYEYAIRLIKMGKAYVDSLSEEEIKEYRGTVTTPGKRSKYANRTIQENLELFERMKNGEFKDGEHVLRAKIDMSSPNMKMRDPLLYRIRHATHYRTGNKWAIYPMYDFAHPLSDYIEGVTHSFCTLEFENNKELYDWILDALNLKEPRPHQYEFARLNMSYTVMSKRKLLELVNKKLVSGWDDPRMPTLAGLKRRGVTPQAILNFCEQIGVAKANSVVDVAQFEFAIRDDLNAKAPRVMCVKEPLEVEIVNFEGSEQLEAPLFPSDIGKAGSRKLSISKTIYIEKEDFSLNPPKGYYRLTPNQPVRLKHAYIIEFVEAIKDENGEVVKIKVKYYPNSKSGQDTSGIKTKSAIQWVDSKTALKAELRIYDRLFQVEMPKGIEDLNPNSLKIVKDALIEPWIVETNVERFQFERIGYFFKEPIDYSKEHPVFNQIVPLKDSWSKKKSKTPQTKQKEQKMHDGRSGELAKLSKEQEAAFQSFLELGLSKQIANIFAREEKLASFFKDALSLYEIGAITIANLVANEVNKAFKEGKEIKTKDIATLAQLIDKEIISSKIAKDVFNLMLKENKDPQSIVKEHNLEQISDPNQIQALIDEVIEKNKTQFEAYKSGNKKLFGFFVGQVLKASGGKANPRLVNELLQKSLN